MTSQLDQPGAHVAHFSADIFEQFHLLTAAIPTAILLLYPASVYFRPRSLSTDLSRFCRALVHLNMSTVKCLTGSRLAPDLQP